MRQTATFRSWSLGSGLTGARPRNEDGGEGEVCQAPALAQPSRLRLGRIAGVTTSPDARLFVLLDVNERMLEFFGDLETRVLAGGTNVPTEDLRDHIGSEAIVVYHREGLRRIIESIAVEAWRDA